MGLVLRSRVPFRALCLPAACLDAMAPRSSRQSFVRCGWPSPIAATAVPASEEAVRASVPTPGRP